MAQLITRTPNLPGQAFPTTTLALITGLSADLLTGSGWIILNADLSLIDASGSANKLQAIAVLDGVYLPQSFRSLSIPAYGIANLHISVAFRPGSGQHTIQIHGASTGGSVNFDAQWSQLSIHEIGY